MPHVLKLNDGKLITPFSMKDVLEEIEARMGPEIRTYIEEWEADVLEEMEADRYDRTEAEKELEGIKDHQHSFLCDLQQEIEAVEAMLDAERLNRKTLQKAVQHISQMLYREL